MLNPIRRARHLPDSGRGTGWLEPLPKLPAARTLQQDGKADCVIVGAGLVGLAAARRLLAERPGWRTVVLDAQRAGHGASGRSSGFLVDLTNFCCSLPRRYQDAHLRLNRAGRARLEALVAEHSIDCDWDDAGWLHASATEAGDASLAKTRAWLEERGERFEVLDRTALTELTGSAFWSGGLRITGSVLIDAGKLVHGLVTSLPEAIELYENSPVVEVARQVGPLGRGGPWRVTTDQASLVTPRLLLATNAGLGILGGLGRLDVQVFPLHTFGSMTAPLSEDDSRTLGGASEWGILGQEPLGSSVRRTRDNRLLMRNTIFHNGRLDSPAHKLEQAVEVHSRAFDARFPQLAGMPFEHSWHGTMGITQTRHPVFGEVEEGVWAAGAFAGMGISLGTLAGELLVDRMLGIEGPLLTDMESMPSPGHIPPRPFRSLGIPWFVWRMNRAAGRTP